VRIRWFGQSAFLLSGERSVFVDPFGDVSRLVSQGLQFDYPPIEGVSADLVLVTHEHGDHNAAEVIGGSPVVLRSTAGRPESPLGEVVAIASEHDAAAGTARGPNTIFCFSLDGLHVAHFGDFGQAALRPEQREAIGQVDVMFVPVGGGPTIGGSEAAELVRSLAPRLVVPMHYRTPAVNFLEPPDEFLDALGVRVERQDGLPVERLDSSEAAAEDLLGTAEAPKVALFAAPVR
jgi:L-ascorbate metabolism protein UlaG (beta-lactamase superfamily)